MAYMGLYGHGASSQGVSTDMFRGKHGLGKVCGSVNTALWKVKKTLEAETREIPSCVVITSYSIICIVQPILNQSEAAES
jgi:hypothetical protein